MRLSLLAHEFTLLRLGGVKLGGAEVRIHLTNLSHWEINNCVHRSHADIMIYQCDE